MAGVWLVPQTAAPRAKKRLENRPWPHAREIGTQGFPVLHVLAIIPVQNRIETQSKEDRDGQTHALSCLAVALVDRALDARGDWRALRSPFAQARRRRADET